MAMKQQDMSLSPTGNWGGANNLFKSDQYHNQRKPKEDLQQSEMETVRALLPDPTNPARKILLEFKRIKMRR